MKIFEAAATLSEELQTSPTMRIVFSFRDGTRMLVGKPSGTESSSCALRAYPDEAAPELVEVEGFACDQAGNLLPEAKKMQRFFPMELIAGFDLIEATPKTLARLRQAFTGNGRRPASAPRPDRLKPEESKGEADSPTQSHLRLAEESTSQP